MNARVLVAGPQPPVGAGAFLARPPEPSRSDRTPVAAGPRSGRMLVGIASTGRPQILARTVADLARQTRRPDAILLSLTGPGDLGDLPDAPAGIEIVTGPKGLPRQRNALLDRLRPGDVLLFLDDDFLLAPDFLARLETRFRVDPEAAMVTGRVLADGILGPGLDHAEGQRRLAAGLVHPADTTVEEVYNGYGCNMAVRADPVLAHGLRFDEALPAYAWFEDVDFSRGLARHGRILRDHALRGVHLGTKTGRSRGRPLGYAQVVNLVYLVRKGTLSRRKALRMIGQNLAANLVRSLRPQPWADHRGRLVGNLIAFGHLLRGTAHPGRMLDL